MSRECTFLIINPNDGYSLDDPLYTCMVVCIVIDHIHYVGIWWVITLKAFSYMNQAGKKELFYFSWKRARNADFIRFSEKYQTAALLGLKQHDSRRRLSKNDPWKKCFGNSPVIRHYARHLTEVKTMNEKNKHFGNFPTVPIKNGSLRIINDAS